VIAERTADNHVDNILTKLGFHSRAQVAVWVVQQGLVKANSASSGDGTDGGA
jgi:non-specific serine/threonine protein kinase